MHDRAWTCRSALRALSFRALDAEPAITRYRMLNKHAISWMMLTPECPLQAHLWHPVVQMDAKVQHTFRLYRNHYTRSRDIGSARRRGRGRDLLLATDLRRAAATRILTTLALIWLYIVVAGAPPSAIRAGVVATLVLAAGLLGRQVSSV
jgi:hypothetical protein